MLEQPRKRFDCGRKPAGQVKEHQRPLKEHERSLPSPAKLDAYPTTFMQTQRWCVANAWDEDLDSSAMEPVTSVKGLGGSFNGSASAPCFNGDTSGDRSRCFWDSDTPRWQVLYEHRQRNAIFEAQAARAFHVAPDEDDATNALEDSISVVSPNGERITPSHLSLDAARPGSCGTDAPDSTSPTSGADFGSTICAESFSGSMKLPVDTFLEEFGRANTASLSRVNTASMSRAGTASTLHRTDNSHKGQPAQAKMQPFRHGRPSAPSQSSQESSAQAAANEGLPAKRLFFRESVKRSTGSKQSARQQHQKVNSAPPVPSRRGQRSGLRREVTEAASAAAAAVTGIKPHLSAGPAGLWDTQSRLHVVRDLLDGYAADPLTGTGGPEEGMVRPGSSGGFLEKYVAQQAEIERLLSQQQQQQLQVTLPDPGASHSRRWTNGSQGSL